MNLKACRNGAADNCRRELVETAQALALWAVFVLVMWVPV